jgi:hypothetical protein
LSAFESVPEFEPTITPDEALIIEVDGFEGPLDLLLALARSQKVDIAKISVLHLPTSISPSWNPRAAVVLSLRRTTS